MATRSTIAKKNEDGTVTQIYCHWDGYPKDGVGETLVKHYNTVEKIDELLALGDLSSLHEKIAPTEGEHTFEKPQDNVTIAYGRDRGETDVEARIFSKTLRRQKEEWNYIFIDGEWMTTRGETTNPVSVTSYL